MSVTTKIACLGIMRDSAPGLVSEANGLRKAENVVLRSPGVLETRPSFDLVYEANGFSEFVRALREFDGVPLAVIKNGSSWSLRNLETGVGLGGLNLEPVDYDAAENAFAESRQNLYVTSAVGVGAVESPSSPAGVRVTGVSMMMQTDLTASQSTNVHKTSCAYRLVFVRKDSNGYIRRSPPSARIICTLTGAPQTFGVATQVYFTPGMAVGDQIEIYRSRAVTGLSPRPEHYLATTYTLTSEDIIAGHTVTQITDSTPDDLLGAQLYTDAARDTELAEKFPPPQAQTLAWWQRVMWYGRTKSPSRMVLQLQNLYYAGIASFCTYHIPLGSQPRRWTFDTVGGAVVTTSDTSGVADIIGMEVTDALLVGPSVAGFDGTAIDSPVQWIKPHTRVVSFIANTSVTLSQGTYTQNGASTPPRSATQPIMGLPVQPANGLSALAISNVSVSTSNKLELGGVWRFQQDQSGALRSGMYITDSASGPTVAGTVFDANTKIFYSDTFAAWYIDKAPLLPATNCTAYIGDVVAVNGVEFYAWLGTSGVPWGTAMATHRLFGIGFPDDTTSAGPVNAALAVQNLCAAINSHGFQTTGFPRATPIGDTWDAEDHEYATSGLRETPGTLATSFLLESDFASAITVKCTSFTAFPLTSRATVTGLTIPGWPATFSYEVAEQVSDDASTPNRVFFSALDEPEAVPLLNYIDIGSKSAPILALVALRNALLVFKTDGLWRITGAGPTGWSVEPIDMTLTLLRPETVCVSNNKAYCWAKGGIFEVDESGARSLTAEKLDVELRQAALALIDDPTTHGAWAVAVQTRNIVLFGVPAAAGDQFTSKVYCYHQVTGAWTEWPVSWGKVCPSGSFDTMYQSRPEAAAAGGVAEIDVEVRKMTALYRGYDRTYSLGAGIVISGDTITAPIADIGAWAPVAGDWISATDGTTRVYRRIVAATYDGGAFAWTLTLEDDIADGGDLLVTDSAQFLVTGGGDFFLISDLSEWQAHEHIPFTIEWQPTAPAGLPVGAICRELQFQLDLTQAPDPASEVSIPEYVVGGSSERDMSPYTLTSNHARTKTVQPLRVGVSRQVARGATLAAYFGTSDIFAIRLVGASIVHEGTSERTRR